MMSKFEVEKVFGHYQIKIDDNTHLFDVDKNIAEYIVYLQKENQKYKEVVNKAIKHVSSLSSRGRDCMIYADVKKDILNILKEVEDD